MTGWLPVLAVALAIVAVVAGRAANGEHDVPAARRALPYVLLLAAAVLAVLSSAVEAATDSRIGIREASMGALALLFGTPAVGWLVTRLRWGAPGHRTFHQQIAANRASSVVLLAILVEVLAVTGFVIGSTFGSLFRATLALGLAAAAASVVGGLVACAVALRRGPGAVLDAVGARPIEGGHTVLRNVVAELSLAAAIPPPGLYLIDDAAPNAFAVGTDPSRASIAVTTGLLEQLDREELQGVIAHEIAHIRNLDTRYGLLVAVIVGGVILLGAAFAALMSNWSIEADGIGGLIAAIALAILATCFGWLVKSAATFAARAVQASVSREREFLADATSVELTRNPAGLIGALAKIDSQPAVAAANAGTRHLWFVSPLDDDADESRWFSTHPWPEERIARLRALGGMREASTASPLELAAEVED